MVLNRPNAIHATPESKFAVGCIGGVALIRLACYRDLGQHLTYQLCKQKDHKLIATGPYSLVRHPRYAACIAHFFAAVYVTWLLVPREWLLEVHQWKVSGSDVDGLYVVHDGLVPVTLRSQGQDAARRVFHGMGAMGWP